MSREAMVRVQTGLLSRMLEEGTDACKVLNPLRKPEIKRVFLCGDVITLVVRSIDLPDTPDDQELPEYTPVFQTQEAG